MRCVCYLLEAGLHRALTEFLIFDILLRYKYTYAETLRGGVTDWQVRPDTLKTSYTGLRHHNQEPVSRGYGTGCKSDTSEYNKFCHNGQLAIHNGRSGTRKVPIGYLGQYKLKRRRIQVGTLLKLPYKLYLE